MHISLWYALEEDLWPMKPNFEQGYFSTENFFHYAFMELSIFFQINFFSKLGFSILWWNVMMRLNTELIQKWDPWTCQYKTFHNWKKQSLLVWKNCTYPYPFLLKSSREVISFFSEQEIVNKCQWLLHYSNAYRWSKAKLLCFFSWFVFYVEVNLHFQKIVTSWAAIPQS